MGASIDDIKEGHKGKFKFTKGKSRVEETNVQTNQTW